MLVAIAMGIFPLMFRKHFEIFWYFNIVSGICFIVDYVLRWITADFELEQKGKWTSFVLYPFTPMAIIDLLSILPVFNLLNPTFKIARVTRLLMTLRVFKVIRYFEPLEIVLSVMRSQRKILLTVLSLAIFYIFVTALIMFNAEEEINPETGKWCSTTYYKDFPWWLNDYNTQQGPDLRVNDNDRVNRYRHLLTTPAVNDEVNRLTEELLAQSNMGKDDTIDFLALTYYAGTYQHQPLQRVQQEMQTIYSNLDHCVGDLLDMLEQKVGMNHVLFYITSTGFTDPIYDDLFAYNIPTGEFYLNRCATLLNMFLMATYGEGDYVEYYYDQQIFLNHKLIENKGLDMAEIQQKASEFLVQFSGVSEVYSANRLLLAPYTERTERNRNGFHRKRSGDLVIEVLPGWQIIDEQTQEKKVVSKAVIPAPFIILNPDFKATTITIPIVAERIAPTIANSIHIRAPNGCSLLPLTE